MTKAITQARMSSVVRSGYVLNFSGQLGHERAQPPADEHEAVIEAQVLGAVKVSRVRRHQG
ncbi:MAG: hypothetical protein JRJ15_02115, partial [Deltaproteobacteria bacterium]|nr:hypothetical protein [Deltaproteobacteria bacterium]